MGTFIVIVIIFGIIIIFYMNSKTKNYKQEAPAIEPYSPRHINSIIYNGDTTELQKQTLWEAECAGRNIVWQGIVDSVQVSPWNKDIISVKVNADYTHLEVMFSSTQKTKLLELSPGSTIKFSANLPKEFPGILVMQLQNAQLI